MNEEAVLLCEADAECPSDWTCVQGLCRLPGFSEIEPLALILSTPEDGAAEVDPEADMLLVFSDGVEPDSLEAATSLRGETPVSVSVEALDRRTLRVRPSAALEFSTRYILRISSTLIATTGAALDAEIVVTFTTQDEPDRAAPLPVTGLHVVEGRDSAGAKQTRLLWTNPEEDFAGALILRSDHGPVSSFPADQTVYQAEDSIGDAVVVAVTTQSGITDTAVPESGADYAVFAYDEARNYATGVRVPFVEAVQVRWYPDETARISVTSEPTNTGLAAIVDLSSPVADHPVDATGSGASLVVASEAFVIGAENQLRVSVSGPTGTWVSEALALQAYPGSLEVEQEPLPVAVGANTRFRVRAGAWSGFEAEVDDDFRPAQERYLPLGVSSDGDRVEVQTQFTEQGSYRVRVRATAPDCDPGAWTVSADTKIGNYRYVLKDAVGTGRGPDDAIGSVADALADIQDNALEDAAIFIAEGTYTEPLLTVGSNLEIQGGYSRDFSTRDFSAHETVLQGTTRRVLEVVGGDTRTLVSGVTLLSTTEESWGGWDALVIGGGASPVFEDVTVVNGSAAIAQFSVVTVVFGEPTFRRLTVRAATSSPESIYSQDAIRIARPTVLPPDWVSRAVVEDSTVEGPVGINGNGIRVDIGTELVLRRSSVVGARRPGVGSSHAIFSEGALVAESNLIDGGSGNSTGGVIVNRGHGVLIGNQVFAGVTTNSANGVFVNLGDTLDMRNNLVTVDGATNGSALASAQGLILATHNTFVANGRLDSSDVHRDPMRIEMNQGSRHSMNSRDESSIRRVRVRPVCAT